MEEITLCRLLPKLMSLYGGYGNTVVLKEILEQNGFKVNVKDADEPPFFDDRCIFYYLGSGTSPAVAAAAKILAPFSDDIRRSIESGTPWLLTGNALCLLADKSLYDGGKTAFPEITTQKNTSKRDVRDVLSTADNIFGAPYVGFVNTQYKFGEFGEPLFKLRHLRGQKKETPETEGFKYKNMFVTNTVGPVLAKNPKMLAHIASLTAGRQITVDENGDIAKAYRITLQELSKRAK